MRSRVNISFTQQTFTEGCYQDGWTQKCMMKSLTSRTEQLPGRSIRTCSLDTQSALAVTVSSSPSSFLVYAQLVTHKASTLARDLTEHNPGAYSLWLLCRVQLLELL